MPSTIHHVLYPLLIFTLVSLTLAQNETTTVAGILNSSSDNSTQTPSSPTNTTVAYKVPVVFGMRIELPADNPFGYDRHGVCSVGPDEGFKVVTYGNNLDKVTQIIWTFTNNCSEPAYVINSHDFIVHFNHKASFNLNLAPLPESVHAYKMCVIYKSPPGQPQLLPTDFHAIDDVSLWITTERPPKEYFLPLPLQIACVVCLLCFSALFSGLTLGLMSLTPQELELVVKSGSKNEQKCAAKILPIRKKGNLLLCALLLGNVIVNSAISILMGELTAGIYALIGSTLGIVIFGEILPQSICSRKGLEVGAHTIAITQMFIFLTFPIAWPVSKLLDWLLGDEYQAYDRKRLMEMIKMSITDNGQVSNELKIAVGAMEIADKVVQDVMTKIEDVFMLPESTTLNAKTVMEIVTMGYTRIPVYSGDKNNVTDMLFVKDLALLDPDDNFTIKTVCGYHKHPVRFVMNDTPLPNLLEAFKKGEGHLAMVKRLIMSDSEHDPSYDLVGVVTLEDIVEEILQAEINDEFDIVTDNVNKVKIKKDRESNRDVTKYFGDHEAPQTPISMQLQIVALQWLVANEPAFGAEYLDKNVLERLIRNSARRCDVSALMAMGDGINVPRLAKLYTKDEPSDAYILILEGRVQVVIGHGQMMFEAGPWHHFGSEIMKKMVEGAKTLGRSISIVGTTDLSVRRPDLMFKPDYSAVVRDDCTYLEINVAAYINAYKASLMQREKPLNDLSDVSRNSSAVNSNLSLADMGVNPIADPSAMLVPETIRKPSVASQDLFRTLNTVGQNLREVGPVAEEEEMALLNNTTNGTTD